MTPAEEYQFGSGQCPSREMLVAFRSGRLSDSVVLDVARHLEQCSRCSSRMTSLDDPLTDSMHEARPGRDRFEERLVEALVRGDPRIDALIQETPFFEMAQCLPDLPEETAKPADSPLPVQIGRFTVRRLLGKGGFGAVYLAWDEKLRRPVALKVPHAHRLADAADLRLYEKEARNAAGLDHPGIVPVYDVGSVQKDGHFFIVSKFIDGQDLGTILKEKPLSERAILELMLALAQALQYMHGQGLIHRDIKPRNILVDAQGRPHLADFGLAKHVGGDATVTLDERVVGTPAYMSPEQVKADPLDARTDIYSLGVVLYEALTGKKPFSGSMEVVMRRLVKDEPPRPRQLKRHISRDLETICLVAMAKNPADRYTSAAEMAADLQRVLDGLPPKRRRVSWPRLLYHRARRHPVFVLLGTLVLLLTIGLVLAMNWTPAPIVLPEQPVPVAITTLPAGAEVHFIPMHPRTGEYQPEQRVQAPGKSPVKVDLLPGNYLVVAVLDDGRFQEVFRYVPGPHDGTPGSKAHQFWKMVDGTAQLNGVRIPAADITAGMCKFSGGESFPMGEAGAAEYPAHRRRVPAFYLDCTEFTVEDATRTYGKEMLPRQLQKYPPPKNYPLTLASWDRAVLLAELSDKRLPDEAEYEFAATLGGTRNYPWGNDANALSEWTPGPVGNSPLDRLEIPGQPPVYGLYSNVAEWTASWTVPYPGSQGMPDPLTTHRIVRGGPYSVVLGEPKISECRVGPRWRLSQEKHTTQPGLGFRCARSVKPRLYPEDFVRILSQPKPQPPAK